MNDTVFANNFLGHPPNWMPGWVVRVTGPLSYEIKLQQGGTIRRHVDALRHCDTAVTPNLEDDETDSLPDDILLPPPPAFARPDPPTNPNPSIPLHRSTRATHPPDRLSS